MLLGVVNVISRKELDAFLPDLQQQSNYGTEMNERPILGSNVKVRGQWLQNVLETVIWGQKHTVPALLPGTMYSISMYCV